MPISNPLSLNWRQVSNINLTLLPILVLLFSIDTLKEESPDTKPDIQLGSGILFNWDRGLVTATIFGKASIISAVRPLLRLHFLNESAIILLRPSEIKCCFCLINS